MWVTNVNYANESVTLRNTEGETISISFDDFETNAKEL